jgi:hypothetical protein
MMSPPDRSREAETVRTVTLPQAPEGLIVWSPTPWPDDRTVLGFSVHDLNRVPPILERMRALREVPR